MTTSSVGRVGPTSITLVALMALTVGCGEGTESEATPETEANKALVQDALRALFVDFDVDAAGALLAEDYIQHNPGVPTGAAPILGFIPGLQDSGIALTVHRIIAEGDLVVVHGTYENAQAFGGETLVGFDVFRVEDGKLAEHWDNLQAPPASTASGRSMTDGPTAITGLERTAENKALVERFAEQVLVGGDFAAAPDFIVSAPGAYAQHNPNAADGLDAMAAVFAELAEAGQAIVYTRVHRVVAEGDFVFVMSEGLFGEQPTAYFDLFRVEDGLIVEHWDTISAIPPDAEWAHDNGKF